jgi:WD40 repeat protein
MDHSPDGKLLAVPLDDELVLFDANTGEYVRSLKGPGGRVVWVTFSHDSGLLAATTWYEGKDGAVRVWDIRINKLLFTKEQPGPKISAAAAFSPDDKYLAVEGTGKIRLLDSISGDEIQSIPFLPGGCASLSFGPDGQYLAAAGWAGKQVIVFAKQGSQFEPRRRLPSRGEPVNVVAYSPDGKVLASGDAKGFTVWDAKTLVELHSVATPAGHIAFTPDSRTLFAAHTHSGLKTVHNFTRWDVDTCRALPRFVRAVRSGSHWCESCAGPRWPDDVRSARRQGGLRPRYRYRHRQRITRAARTLCSAQCGGNQPRRENAGVRGRR